VPRLPGAGPPRHADDRADPRRSAEPGPPLRRQGRRRSQHRAADGGDRQRDRQRDPPEGNRTADVPAEGSRRPRPGPGGRLMTTGGYTLTRLAPLGTLSRITGEGLVVARIKLLSRT